MEIYINNTWLAVVIMGLIFSSGIFIPAIINWYRKIPKEIYTNSYNLTSNDFLLMNEGGYKTETTKNGDVLIIILYKERAVILLRKDRKTYVYNPFISHLQKYIRENRLHKEKFLVVLEGFLPGGLSSLRYRTLWVFRDLHLYFFS